MPPMPVTRFMVFSCSWGQVLAVNRGSGSIPGVLPAPGECAGTIALCCEASVDLRNERSRAHLAAAGVARNQRAARRAGLAHQAEGGRLCIVAEQAPAGPEHD